MGNKTSSTTKSNNSKLQISSTTTSFKQITQDTLAEQQKIIDDKKKKEKEIDDKKHKKRVEEITKNLFSINIKNKLIQKAKECKTEFILHGTDVGCQTQKDRDIFNNLFNDYEKYVKSQLNIDVNMKLADPGYIYYNNYMTYTFTWE